MVLSCDNLNDIWMFYPFRLSIWIVRGSIERNLGRNQLRLILLKVGVMHSQFSILVLAPSVNLP